MGFWPALAVSLAFCVLLGVLIHVLIFRPLRHAPPLAKVVASVGLLLFLQAIVIRRFATTPRAVKPLSFVSKDRVDLGLLKLTQEQLFVAVLVIAFTVALWALFRFTRFGLATRAAAENENGAVVLGFSPDRLAGINWVLSTCITGLLGIFVASINSTVEPLVVPALILPALSAALVGGFSSFGWTTFTAFLLGMQVPLVQFLGVRRSWFPHSGTQPIPGVSQLVPLLVIVVVLYLWGDALPARGAITTGRLPDAPTPPRWALRYGGPALAVLTAAAGLFWLSPAFRGALANSLVGVVICLSLVVLTGYVGQISLAQMSFAGISAFVVSKLSSEHGWPFPLPIFAGAVVALLAGMVVAVPALRVRGVSLAIVTLGCAVTADALIFANPSVNGGLNQAPVDAPGWLDPNRSAPRRVLGITIGDGKIPNPLTAMVSLVAAVVLAYVVANIRRSGTGRQMLAVRANERAAAAAGVNVAGTKVLAFGVSAFIAGIAGGVIAYRSGAASRRPLHLRAVAGGLRLRLPRRDHERQRRADRRPARVGRAGVHLPAEHRRHRHEFTLLLGGLGLIVTAVTQPEGIAGRLRADAERVRRRVVTRRRPTAAPPPRRPPRSGCSQ